MARDMKLVERIRAAKVAFGNPSVVQPESEENVQNRRYIREMEQASLKWSKGPRRWERLKSLTKQYLAECGVTQGSMLEIGGRRNPRNKDFPEFHYSAMDLEDAPNIDIDIDVEVGDITGCPHIPDSSFDFIFSFDVFEHIDRPWLAAEEIQRILKPGGVTVHSTLFSWRYHPCPIDYWRYTPEALAFIFSDLKCIHADFDMTERRRDVRGQNNNAVKPDVFGGWRENVRVNYVGQKEILG